MPGTQRIITIVSCVLLLFILMEGAKPAYGKKASLKRLEKKVKALEKKVEGIVDEFKKCKRK